jgi:ABC-type dipeptide/oligopeptide/nickel transport system permease component
VVDLISWRFANTLFLAGVTAMIAVPVAVILGILAALYRNTLFDRLISMATLSTISFPEFFVAYILIALLSVQVVAFPTLIFTPLWPAGAIAFLTVGVNLIVDWFLHIASGLED